MLIDWLQKPSTIACGLYLAAAELSSCLPSYSFSCILVSEEDHTKNYSGNQTCATVHEAVFRFLRFNWINAGRDNINAFAAVAVAVFTFNLCRSTLKLWEAGEKQRESNERIAALQRHSSEKIGEAQVRAYVNIKSAGMGFLLRDIHPRVLFGECSGSGYSGGMEHDLAGHFPSPREQRGKAPREHKEIAAMPYRLVLPRPTMVHVSSHYELWSSNRATGPPVGTEAIRMARRSF